MTTDDMQSDNLPIRIRRTRRLLFNATLNLIIVVIAAAYFVVDAESTRSTYSMICAVLFGIWSLAIVQSLARRNILAEVGATEIIFRGPYRTKSFPTDTLIRYSLPGDAKFGHLYFQQDGTERFYGISQKTYGPENYSILRQAIAQVRPDLENQPRPSVS